MARPTTKITLLAALLTFATADGASSRQRTFYDSSGKPIAHSMLDTQGTVTHYDAKGNVMSRESSSGGTTTVNFHDARGRKVGTFTTTKH